MQKLYQQEGVNPMGGVPDLYYSSDHHDGHLLFRGESAAEYPAHRRKQGHGGDAAAPAGARRGKFVQRLYGEIDLVKHFDFFKDFLPMFSADEAANIASFGQGLIFLA